MNSQKPNNESTVIYELFAIKLTDFIARNRNNERSNKLLSQIICKKIRERLLKNPELLSKAESDKYIQICKSLNFHQKNLEIIQNLIIKEMSDEIEITYDSIISEKQNNSVLETSNFEN